MIFPRDDIGKRLLSMNRQDNPEEAGYSGHSGIPLNLLFPAHVSGGGKVVLEIVFKVSSLVVKPYASKLHMNIARQLSAHLSLRNIGKTPRLNIRMAESNIHHGGQFNFRAGPLVWIDCEMTGLNPKHDMILEIAVIITDGNLHPVDAGIEFVIKRDKSILDNMDQWCIEQHGKSGLTQACLESPCSKNDVSSAVLEYIKKWVPEKRTGVLAGSSVHADRSFLVEEMPEVVEWLHYRIVDVSSVKELCRRWYPGIEAPSKNFSRRHRALEDIKDSIRELAWYRENIFRAP